MKYLLASVLVFLSALPALAADWEIPRPQLEIPELLAQAAPVQLAHAPAVRNRTTRNTYDEALSLPRGRGSYAQSQRQQTATITGTPVQVPQNHAASYAANPTADPRVGRLYIAGAVSGVFADDANANSTDALANAILQSLAVEAEFDTGYGALAAVGWRVLPAEEFGPRLELEAAYQKNDVTKLTSTAGILNVAGDMSVFSVMVNAAFDLYTGTAWLPYFGAGAGFANVDAEVTAAGLSLRGDDTVIAGQLIGGVAYALSDLTFLTLDYRYFLTDEVNIAGGLIEPSFHKVSLGMRHQF